VVIGDAQVEQRAVDVEGGDPAIGQDCGMEWLTDVGLGLEYDTLRLDRTSQAWIDAGTRLRDDVAGRLGGSVVGVEQIGSSSVLTLLAKPVIDIAVGLGDEHEFSAVRDRLEATGWIYRGDAGANGGHVFVFETKPRYRVAHVHVVDHDGEQWRDYLRLRDFLRRSSAARARYEAVKQQLASEFGDDRTAYTDGKTDIVHMLLDEADRAT